MIEKHLLIQCEFECDLKFLEIVHFDTRGVDSLNAWLDSALRVCRVKLTYEEPNFKFLNLNIPTIQNFIKKK